LHMAEEVTNMSTMEGGQNVLVRKVRTNTTRVEEEA
jgi:hypothetical protein